MFVDWFSMYAYQNLLQYAYMEPELRRKCRQGKEGQRPSLNLGPKIHGWNSLHRCQVPARLQVLFPSGHFLQSCGSIELDKQVTPAQKHSLNMLIASADVRRLQHTIVDTMCGFLYAPCTIYTHSGTHQPSRVAACLITEITSLLMINRRMLCTTQQGLVHWCALTGCGLQYCTVRAQVTAWTQQC